MSRHAEEAARLLQRLIACDTSNPPGRETQAAGLLAAYLTEAGLECELAARDPERANLIARLRGGSGPTLAFLCHLDVVPVEEREAWSVEPFAGAVLDGSVWGRGAVDMKSQVAAVAVALAELARAGERPPGDVLLIAVADEEIGSAKVGAEWLVDERPDVAVDFVVGEGAGERFDVDGGALYLFTPADKGSAPCTVRVLGHPADASLPGNGVNPLVELARLVARLDAYAPEPRLEPEVVALVDAVAPGDAPAEERLARARAAHPALERLLGGVVVTTFTPTIVETDSRRNTVPSEAVLELQCSMLPGETREDVERALREALGEGEYEVEVEEPHGGSRSPHDTPLRRAIESFLEEHDPGARLAPTLGYGFSDCHWWRERFGSVAHGFIPFRHADPLVNLTTKHGVDERVLVADLGFQVECALALSRTVGR